MKIYIPIILSLIFAGEVVTAADQEPIKLDIDSERSVFYKPEDVWVKVQFIATPADGITILTPTMNDGKDVVRFEIISKSEKEERKLSYKGFNFHGPISKVHIPKERPLEKFFNLRSRYGLTAPGTYQVRAVYSDPTSSIEVASEVMDIEIRSADTREVVADRELEEFNSVVELLKLTDNGRELFQLVEKLPTKKSEVPFAYSRGVRLSLDLKQLLPVSSSNISIVDVAHSGAYKAVTISLGNGSSLLVEIGFRGPEVFDRVVEVPSTALKCKLLESGRHVWIDEEGNKYGKAEED